VSESATRPVLEVSSVIAGYRPDLPILHGVSVHVYRGEIVTIIGPNGAGKSTLIKAIAGLVKVSSGSVVLDKQDITELPPHQLPGAGVGYVAQTRNVFTSLSIYENLVMGGATLPRRVANERIEEVLAMYPFLDERRSAKAGVLSGGQRQTLAVARVLLTQPRLILLDEPTAGLSPRAAAELFNVIRQLADNDVAILMVEQNAKAALRQSDRGYVLVEGQNRIDGPAQALLDDEQIGEIFLGVRVTKENI
jgi:ABC-type branched-subunit amino acid transport system ATPase component